MDIFKDYFYIIILIVGAIVQWLKSRSERVAPGSHEREENGYDPDDLEEFESEAENMNSRPAVPPPLPRPGGALPGVGRSAVPDLRRVTPPPLTSATMASDASAELARQQAMMDQARAFQRARRERATMETRQTAAQAAPSAPSGTIRSRLHNRRELRSAFVLKEILDKPVGLR